MICKHAVQWIRTIEERTDIKFDYSESSKLYQKCQKRKSNPLNEEKTINKDVLRTFQESTYFSSEEGKHSLTRLLVTLTKHASFGGYLQGMNNIAGALLYHSNETIAFELIIRLLNDYHLKEVHMFKLPGLYYHCEVMDIVI
jgi:hypothetical protein